MLQNYLQIALRNIRKNKVFSFINIFGLTVGLTSFLLIALYIFDELTYDRFHQNARLIYRVIENKTSESGKESMVNGVPYNVSERAKKDFPELVYATRVSAFGRTNVFKEDNTNPYYEDYLTADASFLKIFDFPTLKGNREALSNPFSVVLTDQTAVKIFGHMDVIGKAIRTDRDSIPYKVTAVISIPANSHLQFNLLFSESSLFIYQGFNDFRARDWTSNNFVTYFQLKDNTDPTQTESKVNKLVNANRENATTKSSFLLQPLKKIHFHSAGIEGETGSSGNLVHMYVFGIVAAFVLLIACINYMNLSTSRFIGRAKEVAVRKVAGAQRIDLIKQFLFESMFVTVTALVLALAAVKLLLPAFNQFSEKELSLGSATDYRVWIGVFVITIGAGLLSGFYPALFQSKLKPFLLLKNKIRVGKSHTSFRRVLVVFQFSLSIIMIISTIIVYQQLQFVSNKDMGFNKEQLVVVDINSGRVRRSAETIKTEYARLPGIQNVSVTSRVPGEWKILPKVKVKTTGGLSNAGEDIYYIGADNSFLETFQIKLVDGRNFSASFPGDSSAVLINEEAAKLLGIKSATEQLIEIPSVDFNGNIDDLTVPFKARVIGIVKDFNFQSLREKVSPMVIANQNNPIHNIDYFTARVNTSDIPSVLAGMESILHKVDPQHIFEFNFLDKQWENFYREDLKRQVIFMAIALLTILIACMGLFGLATYAAQQRIKEIGIRKVLGANVTSLVSLLSSDFLKLVIIASVIAFPISWFAMDKWLQDFAYRVNISPIVFVIAAAAALLIALLTVSAQAIKAAMSNPVKSLRTE